ncbi:MAG: 16S rRNA (cytosine(967)-C(5))-methyltransferase RsmB [Acidobacteriia bacterium]|nr:16S rRNA (cytosine(967)-C(5))-methyltransferase RsmB [Terriglobia bacterium]
MAVSLARAAAFEILLRVERESAYAVELLHSASVSDLAPADRNLTMEIVMGVLRWQPALDAMFAPFITSALAKLDLEVLTALRMGAYQLARLTRIPPHAVVNETVELVKRARKKSAAGMVNAVMRKLKPNLDPYASDLTGVEYLSTALAHPKWLVERWVQSFGYGRADLICTYDQQIPATAVRLSRAEDPSEVEAKLRNQGVQLAPGRLMNSARVVVEGDVTKTDLFPNGGVAIQDEGSQLVAALIGDGDARLVLDCCAAPGGKTAALAARLPHAKIIAAELHPHRARLLRKMVPQENVLVVTADALHLPFRTQFDRVLVDVPCSGTGTLARNPEIKWRLKPEDLCDLHARQLAILTSALAQVAPGGRLVYSTCSLEPEENEQVVAACLQGHRDFRLVPARQELLKLQAQGELVWKNVDDLVSGEFLRTLPGVQPCDGFFAAILEKQ